MLNSIKDSQLAILERNPEYRARGKECPICRGAGEYVYKGETHPCPDDDYGHVMLRLAKLYWLAFIPLEYQRLLWDEFPHEEAKQQVDDYLENFDRLRLDGIGYTIYGREMGTGKTWSACYILKELAKRGYNCHFASFLGVRGYYDLDDKDEKAFKIKRIRESEVLVLDEVKKPLSDAQRDFFEDTLEELLRDRTYMNFPTIVTSNMDLEQFEHWYPRCFSLLAGKNITVELKGEDARVSGVVFQNNVALALKGETRPIT
jgi:hypothetical protein